MIRSNSLEGTSQVFAEFRLDTDVARAIQDVRDKIALVRPGFPRDVKDPLVIRADGENTEPVVTLAVMSPTVNLRELTALTDQTIVKGLENVPGVARIDVNGGRRKHRRGGVGRCTRAAGKGGRRENSRGKNKVSVEREHRHLPIERITRRHYARASFN